MGGLLRLAAHFPCAALIAVCCVAGDARAADHGPHCYPPPYYRAAPTKVWASRQDWRHVEHNNNVDRHYQAFFLKMERYFQSRRCWPAATYHRLDIMDVVYDQPMCGPRSTRRPKDDCD